VFDGLVLPFGTHRLAALLFVSALTGALLALLFRATSNQDGIRRSRNIFKARVLEMRIYPDDAVLIARALGGALAAQGNYLRVALKPILIVLVVALPIFFQLEARYAPAPLRAGERTLVTVTLKEGLDPLGVPATLAGTDGIRVEPGPLRIPATREVVWRADVSGKHDEKLTATVYDLAYVFGARASQTSRVIGESRTAHAFADALIHPGLPPIPADSPIARVQIRYADASYHLFGHPMGWLAVFLIGSFVGAVIPSMILRIQL
jgi:hypothetical protein